jgi:hypothetical protein
MDKTAHLLERRGDNLTLNLCSPTMNRVKECDKLKHADRAAFVKTYSSNRRAKGRRRSGAYMKRNVLLVLLALSVGVANAQMGGGRMGGQPPAPQAAPADPLTNELKQALTRIGNNLLAMAEKMPEDQYGFKAVPEIRSFAGTMGHTIDSRMRACAGITGSNTQLNASAMTAKAELVAAMKTSIAECDKALGSLTDATVVQLSGGGRGPQRSRLGTLYGTVAHDNEEYGYMSIYLRLKGIVPPSTEGMAGRGAGMGAPAPQPGR